MSKNERQVQGPMSIRPGFLQSILVVEMQLGVNILQKLFVTALGVVASAIPCLWGFSGAKFAFAEEEISNCSDVVSTEKSGVVDHVRDYLGAHIKFVVFGKCGQDLFHLFVAELIWGDVERREFSAIEVDRPRNQWKLLRHRFMLQGILGDQFWQRSRAPASNDVCVPLMIVGELCQLGEGIKSLLLKLWITDLIDGVKLIHNEQGFQVILLIITHNLKNAKVGWDVNTTIEGCIGESLARKNRLLFVPNEVDGHNLMGQPLSS